MTRILAAIAVLTLADCATAELGRRSAEISNPPTLPADCAEVLTLGRDCAVTVPPARIADFGEASSSPITRARRSR